MDTLLETLPTLEQEMASAQEEVYAAQRRVAALKKIIEGIKALNGHAATVVIATTPEPVEVEPNEATPPPDPFDVLRGVVGNGARHVAVTFSHPDEDHDGAENAPKGREAVRRIVAERPGIWTLAQIVRELDRRGWLVSRKAAEVAVHRLADKGEAKRVGNGVYSFAAATPASEDREEVERETDDSGEAMISPNGLAISQ
jgi:hypothetical protein